MHVLEYPVGAREPIIAPPPTRQESSEFTAGWYEDVVGAHPHIRLDTPDEDAPHWLLWRCSLRVPKEQLRAGWIESGWGFTPQEAYQRWAGLTRMGTA